MSVKGSNLNIETRGLKIQESCLGVAQFFAKIHKGGQGFQDKLPWGGSPYYGCYSIFINKCFEICLGGGVSYINLSPCPPHPHCVPL